MEPSREELDLIDTDAVLAAPPAWEDPLEDLFEEAQRAETLAKKIRNPKAKLPTVRAPSAREAFLSRYSFPENWTAVRAIALIDRASQTLLGTFTEWQHNHTSAKKYLREHSPVEVSGSLEIDGYLGAAQEQKIKSLTWDKEFSLVCDLILDELQVESPAVPVRVLTRFGATVRVELTQDTQFACASGNVLLSLSAGTDILPACSTDTKILLRKGMEK